MPSEPFGFFPSYLPSARCLWLHGYSSGLRYFTQTLNEIIRLCSADSLPPDTGGEGSVGPGNA